MILGVGIDLCDAGRIEKSLARPGFVDRVFSPEEQALLSARAGRTVPRLPPRILRPKRRF